MATFCDGISCVMACTAWPEPFCGCASPGGCPACRGPEAGAVSALRDSDSVGQMQALKTARGLCLPAVQGGLHHSRRND